MRREQIFRIIEKIDQLFFAPKPLLKADTLYGPCRAYLPRHGSTGERMTGQASPFCTINGDSAPASILWIVESATVVYASTPKDREDEKLASNSRLTSRLKLRFIEMLL
jgi:hypothetical protein